MSTMAALWARRRDRPVLVALAALALAVLLAYPFADWWFRAQEFGSAFRFGDFGAYNAAVERWKGGEELYRRTDDGGFWGSYLYPPVVVLLFLPFTEPLPFRQSAMAWVAVTGLLLWLGLQALVGALGYDLRWFERLGLAWLLAGFHPVLLTAKMGQTSLFLGAVLAFAGATLVRDGTDGADGGVWALVSGACTAVVGIVKMAYAPVGAHLLHDPRRLKGALLTVLPVAWLSVRFFGLDAHRTYVEVLQWGIAKGGDSPRSPTLWLPPYFKPLDWLPAPQAVRVLVCLGIVGLAVLAPPRARRTVFALGVAAFPLVTPQTYTYYLVALLPAAVVLLAVELERDGYPELVVASLLAAHFHAYGLNFFVNVVPDAVPAFAALEPAYLLFQPGLWASATLVGLAAVRVAETVDLDGTVALARRRVRSDGGLDD
jgi:hypothetical protein